MNRFGWIMTVVSFMLLSQLVIYTYAQSDYVPKYKGQDVDMCFNMTATGECGFLQLSNGTVLMNGPFKLDSTCGMVGMGVNASELTKKLNESCGPYQP